VTDLGTGGAADSLAEMLDEREHLLDIALWMFGSTETAERIVQETYRRWYALDEDERREIAVPRAWLTHVAGRISLDLLSESADSRASYALPKLDAPVAPRQAARQRRSEAQQDPITLRFAMACTAGSVAVLRDILAPDAIVVSDGGGKVRAATHPVQGADEVARFVTKLLSSQADTTLSVEAVNGRLGVVLRRAGDVVAVVTLTVAGTRIAAVWIVLNPDKLLHWQQD
jgi:RNA polymerase sigma-70 factor (ECF subfamily)